VRHPHTRPGYFARKVGGLLPSKGTACKTKGKGKSRSSCSDSTVSGHGSSNDAGGGSSASGRSIQNAPDTTAQHGMSNSSGATQPHLYISYSADGGMANQAISHWNAMATAIALGAKGIVSRAVPPNVLHMLAINPAVVAPGSGFSSRSSCSDHAAGTGSHQLDGSTEHAVGCCAGGQRLGHCVLPQIRRRCAGVHPVSFQEVAVFTVCRTAHSSHKLHALTSLCAHNRVLLCCGAVKGIEVVSAPCSFEHYKLGERYMLQDGNFFDLDQSEASRIKCGWRCN
jgi:hypothetical protein